MLEGFVCPVCGYNEPESPSYADGQGEWYQEICCSCGTQFAYDDATTSHAELRQRWVAAGSKWWSSWLKPPADWDPQQQLRLAGLTAP